MYQVYISHSISNDWQHIRTFDTQPDAKSYILNQRSQWIQNTGRAPAYKLIYAGIDETQYSEQWPAGI